MESRSKLTELKRRFVPPQGLNHSRPRDVRLTGGGRALVVTAVMLFAGAVVVGILLQQVALRDAADRQIMRETGVETTAEVTRLWRGSGDPKPAWVAYRFEVDGRTYEGRSKIGLSRWRTLAARSPLPITYVPADPERSVVAGRASGGLPIWLPPLVAIAMAGFGWMCLLPLRAERRLLMEGRPAPAVVTAHRKHHSSHGGTHRSMTYEFPLLTGATATGKCGTSSKPPAVGSVICVVYDPDRPTRSASYPFKLVRPGVG